MQTINVNNYQITSPDLVPQMNLIERNREASILLKRLIRFKKRLSSVDFDRLFYKRKEWDLPLVWFGLSLRYMPHDPRDSYLELLQCMIEHGIIDAVRVGDDVIYSMMDGDK